MKVIYDIRVLGLGQRQENARTGVVRVVENVAKGLLRAQDCSLTFHCDKEVDRLASCLEYTQSTPCFRRVPLIGSRYLGLRKFIDDHRVGSAPSYGQVLTSGDLRMIARELKPVARILRRLALAAHPVVNSRLDVFERKRIAATDIYHSTLFAIPDQVRRAKGVSVFQTVYDLIPVLYPEYFLPWTHRFFGKMLDGLTPEDWVIAISRSTKDDLCSLRGIDPSRVFVVHPAASQQLFYPCADQAQTIALRRKYGIPPGPYLLTLNTLEPRKNVEHTIKCFARLVTEQRLSDLSLVLIGSRGWLCDDTFETIEGLGPLRNRVVLTGRVPDADLSALYSDALAFLYMSKYEGFGLPVLEAMQCGLPVITSNTSSLPEVVGDAGMMLDPSESDGLCQSILDIYSRPTVREALSLKSLQRARLFSWERCTQETAAAYRAALAG